MAEAKRNTRTTKTRSPQPVSDYGRLQPQAPELEEARTLPKDNTLFSFS